MKESYWGYWLVILGIFIIVVMMLTQDATTISSQDYYQLKEVANAAILDSIDYNYYAETYDIRMHKEIFVANFMKRFAQSVDMTNTYRIDFVDLYESPPKVSIKISTKSNSFVVAGAGDITDLDVTNSIDLIVQYDGKGPADDGFSNTDTTVIDGCSYYTGYES
ncbi:MAG: DUF5411 family protein [Candidatus Coprovivens sp.]